MCRHQLGMFAVVQLQDDGSKRKGEGRVLVVILGWRWKGKKDWIQEIF